jgi:hypothetical protein
VPPSNQMPGERIGNLAREEAASLALFMDDKIDMLTEINLFHAVDYKFSCTLSENLHHKREGYKIQIIVYSNHPAESTSVLINALYAQKLNAVQL